MEPKINFFWIGCEYSVCPVMIAKPRSRHDKGSLFPCIKKYRKYEKERRWRVPWADVFLGDKVRARGREIKAPKLSLPYFP